MSSQDNNVDLSKQLPFYRKTIKPRIKEFTNAKLVIICDYYFYL